MKRTHVRVEWQAAGFVCPWFRHGTSMRLHEGAVGMDCRRMAFQSTLQPLQQQLKCIVGASQDATFQWAVNCNRMLFGSQLA